MPAAPVEVQIDDIIRTLQSQRLFSGLSQEELAAVANAVEVFAIKRGEIICTAGQPAEALWFLLSGTCYRVEKKGRKTGFSGLLEAGSSWGMECLRGDPYPVSVQVLKPGMVLRLRAAEISPLAGRIPRLAGSLYVTHQNDRAAKGLRMGWLEAGEKVIYTGRRHPAILVRRLILPAMITLLDVIGLFWSLYTGTGLTGWSWLAGLSMLLDLGWAFWRVVDWRNDRAVVTDLRIIWLERTAWIYDSRVEAPLTSVQSVDVQTTQMGRLLRYGHVIVHTVNGPLLITDVPAPDTVAAIIYDQWQAAQESQKKADNLKMETALREQLRNGKGSDSPLQPEMKLRAGGGLLRRAAALFSSREVADDVITYRKHGFVLFKKTWQPILILAILAALALTRVVGFYEFLPIAVVLVVLLVGMIPFVSWWAYQYQDWRNDFYQIQADSIIAVERKPFGDETRNAAMLENILSIQYKRAGLIGAVMNFGTVSIAVGTTRIEFKDVYNPSRVQAEIFSAMNARNEQRRTQRVSEERERAEEWIATYNRIQDEERKPAGEVTSNTPENLDIS